MKTDITLLHIRNHFRAHHASLEKKKSCLLQNKENVFQEKNKKKIRIKILNHGSLIV